MNTKKIFPFLLALPLVISGCGTSPKKKSTSTPTPSSSSEQPSSSSAPAPSSSGTSQPASSSSSSPTPAPSSSSSVIPPAPSSSSSVVPPTPTSSGTSVAPTPVDPHTPQEYLDEFNLLKNTILNQHNYTLDVHTDYIDEPDKPEESQDESYDNQTIMINNKVYCYDSGLLSGKTGYIYQKNQGYVTFDYYGANVLPGKFYSTNPSIGITDFEDLTAENFYLGSYTQEVASPSTFKTSSADVMALIINFSAYSFYSEVTISPEYAYFSVDIEKHELTMDAHFTYDHYDEYEKKSDIHVIIKVNKIGTTTNETFESYLENPTTTYPVRTEWSEEEETLLRSRFAGEIPTFPSGASYAFFVEDYNDSGTYKILVSDRASGNLTSSYAEEIVDYERYTEVTSERDSRLFKRIYDDPSTMTRYTHTIEMAYEEASVRYPNGRFDILFKGTAGPTTIDSVQAFNTYLSTKGYSQFVPQFGFDSSYTITKFTDMTESKNQELGYHGYEFYSGTSAFRVYIPSYSDALAAQESYVIALNSEAYGFTKKSSFLGQVVYSNEDKFESPSSVTMTSVEAMGQSSYEAQGFIEFRYQVYALKDPSETPTLVKIQIDTACQSDFTVGDTFTYGSGVIHALYSDGNWSSNIASECTFSGYDMSKSGDQHVTVTYSEGGVTVFAYYDIHVASSDSNYTASTSLVGGADFLINLCADGTGTYTFTRVSPASTGTTHFTYTIVDSVITFTLAEDISSSLYGRFNLFAGTTTGTTRVGSYDSEADTITVTLSNASGASALEVTFVAA